MSSASRELRARPHSRRRGTRRSVLGRCGPERGVVSCSPGSRQQAAPAAGLPHGQRGLLAAREKQATSPFFTRMWARARGAGRPGIPQSRITSDSPVRVPFRQQEHAVGGDGSVRQAVVVYCFRFGPVRVASAFCNSSTSCFSISGLSLVKTPTHTASLGRMPAATWANASAGSFRPAAITL